MIFKAMFFLSLGLMQAAHAGELTIVKAGASAQCASSPSNEQLVEDAKANAIAKLDPSLKFLRYSDWSTSVMPIYMYGSCRSRNASATASFINADDTGEVTVALKTSESYFKKIVPITEVEVKVIEKAMLEKGLKAAAFFCRGNASVIPETSVYTREESQLHILFVLNSKYSCN